MNRADILRRLEKTGITIEGETATPVEGAAIPLPYLTVRTAETDEWDDAGRVCLTRTNWTVTLFTVNKDDGLERRVRQALALAGTVRVDRFPDEEPYQVDFTNTTKGA